MEIRYSKQAAKFLKKQSNHFTLTRKISWDDIEEVTPDDWDLAMLNEIKNTPEEQQSYITQDQLLAELGL